MIEDDLVRVRENAVAYALQTAERGEDAKEVVARAKLYAEWITGTPELLTPT